MVLAVAFNLGSGLPFLSFGNSSGDALLRSEYNFTVNVSLEVRLHYFGEYFSSALVILLSLLAVD